MREVEWDTVDFLGRNSLQRAGSAICRYLQNDRSQTLEQMTDVFQRKAEVYAEDCFGRSSAENERLKRLTTQKFRKV